MHYRLIPILGHVTTWLVVIAFLTNSSLVWGSVITNQKDTLIPQLYGAVTNALIFYCTCYFLLPVYFNARYRMQFITYSILTLILVSLAELWVDFEWWQHQFEPILASTYFRSLAEYISENVIYVVLINAGYYLFAFGYRLPINKRLEAQKQAKIESDKLQTELKFLKAQIDPHTLFNGMNSIYHLIDPKPEKAKEVLLRFTELIRYQLYECGEQWVDIDQEIKYIRNYVELNRMRIEEDCRIYLSIDSTDEAKKIAPLIFTPFLENGFKYLSGFENPEENVLRIALTVEEGHTRLTVENTVSSSMTTRLADKRGGIGLVNVKNRLDLLYGTNYTLMYGLDETESVFKVDLKLGPHKQT